MTRKTRLRRKHQSINRCNIEQKSINEWRTRYWHYIHLGFSSGKAEKCASADMQAKEIT